ncbi:ABC transporter substrate-binding protein [Celeribacter litoreus]|uniref:ABC transporter substrate-binding protein n=1 Tax=Celeribacter litoreus TaxID=2876714 RepID=UPI001CCB4651|nr:ABC transporter substrate-binding protein [Celeribacter litoreus]MCA0044436.1 ABC transporter substrate-binding protein [Celeribacter litoreus]
MRRLLRRTIFLALFACVGVAGAVAEARATLEVKIGYLRMERPPRPVLSNLDEIPPRRGIEGAELALSDNMTTGAFLGHDYALEVVSVPVGGPLDEAAAQLLATHDLVVLDMPLADVQMVADMAGDQKILFNAGARDHELRSAGCRANLLHTIPETGMEADALMQVLLAKKWTKLALIEGPTVEDQALADSYRKSARKFGLKIVSEKQWTFDTDLRRAASREVPLFTQGFKDHDVLLVADAHDDFARYIEHNTWKPRPVVGSTGLMARAWFPVVEQWGAAQLQSRFKDMTGRDMTPEDYAAWAAVRAVGEAVTRTGSNQVDVLRAYLLSDDFALAAFQGRPLSFRAWNGQLRQPLPVVNARAQVASAPLDGFEHARNPLDTLGTDQVESACQAFGE